MGFLDNTSITVDAILTKKGRELLARGQNEFKITKFALADDEIDYNLYDTSHPNGSNFFSAVIENMPLLEAFVDETQVMRYKLFTADKDLPKLATIKGLRASEKLELGTDGKNLIPTTDGFTDDVYDFTIQNVDVASMTSEGTTPSFARDGRSAVIRNVKSVNLKATDRTGLTNPIVQTVVFVTSRNTGATTSVIIKNDSTGQFPND